MAWVYITLLVPFVLACFLLQRFQNKHKNLPPSPPSLPILGHLHLLGKTPHHDLCHLAKRHGPVMLMWFGFVPNVVVSSPRAAEQVLKTHDRVFATRPPHEAARHISYDQKNLSFAQYGPYWRHMRKLFTLELLTGVKIESFREMRRREVALLVGSIAAEGGAAVDVSGRVAAVNADMSCQMVFGRKYDDEEFGGEGFKAVIKEAMVLAAVPNLGDYFPGLGRLDLQGVTRRMRAVSKVFDGFFEKIIDDHVELTGDVNGRNKDAVDMLLGVMRSGETEFEFGRDHIKALMLDLLIGSMDTAATSIEWVISELIRHPKAMKKLQDELQQVVGLERMVEELDLEKLQYLDLVIKESFRLHPVAPLLIPHAAMEDGTIDGYHIPKGARVIVNTWAIGRDPSIWLDPEKFIPERFIGNNIDFNGGDFKYLPFGSGRRSCPGKQLGLTVVRLVVAQLVHCFNWELPDKMVPQVLDMTEDFGLVVTRATHLHLIPSYRLTMKTTNECN